MPLTDWINVNEPDDATAIRSSSGTSSFSNDTVRFTAVSTHACYNGEFGI